MRWKKSVLSYIWWALYLVCAGAALGYFGYSVCADGAQLQDMLLLCGGALLWIAVGAVALGAGYRKKKPASIIWEGVLVTILLAAGLAVRILCLDYAGEDAAYFETAMVTGDSNLPTVVHGGTYFYLQLLRVLFTVVGNQWMAGIWLQIALQMLACLALYVAIRRMAGALSGILVTCLMMFAPKEVLKGLTYSPDVLYLLVYSLGLLSVSSMLLRIKERMGRDFWHILQTFLAGAWVGYAIYLDVAGVSLLVFAFGAFLLQKEQAYDSAALEQRCQGGWTGFLTLLLTAAGFVGLYIWFDSYLCNDTFLSTLGAWWEVHSVKGFFPLFWLDVSEQLAMSVLLCGLLLGAILAFPAKRGVRFGLLFAGAVSLGLMAAFGMSGMRSGMIHILVYFVVALIGSSLDELAVMAAEFRNHRRQKRRMLLAKAGPEKATEESAEPVSASAEPADEVPEQVQMLHNPLPMPKKSERKKMDYSTSVEDEVLFFDLEVDEEDDFDV